MIRTIKKLKYLMFVILPIQSFSAGLGFLAYEGVFNNTTIESSPINMRDRSVVSAQFQYTGTTLDGSCTLQASNDGVNYTSITSVNTIFIPTGGTDIINKSDIGTRWLKATCTSVNTNPVDMKIYLEAK